MKLMWVTSNRIGSKLIRWGLDSDCSHFAICFDEGEVDSFDVAQGIAFHSYGHGTQLEWLKSFLCRNYVMHAIELIEPLSLEREEAVYKAILNTEADRPYDYAALAWFAWRAVMAKLLGVDISGINRWQRPEARLCTGIAPAVLQALGVKLPTTLDVELLAPHALYQLLMASGHFKEAPEWAHDARECHEDAIGTVRADVVLS